MSMKALHRCRISGLFPHLGAILASVILLMPALVTTRSAQAQSFTVLYSFTGGVDGGGGVYAGLVRDGAGNFYGTTYGSGASHLGVVFKLDTTGKESVLHSFAGGSDGANPHAGLVHDAAGNLFGTTVNGGSTGSGTVFKVAKTRKETVLYEFMGGADGAHPYAGLLRDSAGNLYGTTIQGGAFGLGVVFKVDTAGIQTVLHSFAGAPADGASPFAGLIQDAAGNLYGTTQNGGTFNFGTVFMLDTAGNETVLYSFSGGADGGLPYYGHLIRNGAGNLFGTTFAGGSSVCLGGCGVVFRVDKTGNETVLYRFTGGPFDGQAPFAGMVADSAGDLYGTTSLGGAFGNGTLFKLDKTGKETVLHSLSFSTDGAYPYSGLIRDAAGNFYGTTETGGSAFAGTVFKLTP